MPLKTSRFAKLAIFCTSVIFSLIIAEGVVRLVATFNINVRYLANAGSGQSRIVVNSLEDFAKAYPVEFIPHRSWRGYWTNLFGFYDREFDENKPSGQKRIIAIGDSFNYGMVSLPDNVIYVAREKLRELCPNTSFDVLNMGAPSLEILD